MKSSARRPDVGIVTLAPELDGGLDLIRWLTARGHRVSLGHSAATFERGARGDCRRRAHATHLFNRMPPFEHRAPGLVGAILQTDEVAAELICDGVHVHPAVVRTAIAAKRPSRVLAITDGTAASGLPAGARAMLGGQPITVRDSAAFLDDGTLAGSVSTMDRVFQMLVGPIGLSLVDAATVCSTTAARELGLVGHGVLAVDAVADLRRARRATLGRADLCRRRAGVFASLQDSARLNKRKPRIQMPNAVQNVLCTRHCASSVVRISSNPLPAAPV